MALEVWNKLHDLFGERLFRKFGKEPPELWVNIIVKLNEYQLKRGFERMLHAGLTDVPSLPQFQRFCRSTALDDEPGEKRALPAPTKQDNYDRWDMEANTRLMKFIMTTVSREPRIWGAHNSPEIREATLILVRYKNQWAIDMREGKSVNTETGEVEIYPLKEREKNWNECMRLAIEEIQTVKAP